MSDAYDKLEPGLVFKYFREISNIPRGSGNEKAVSDYLVEFARSNNLEVVQDEVLNVIIKKPGTAGYEEADAVIIQGHMDMVCDKNKGTVHDFEKDPIRLRVEGDMLYAADTTLGADDGIAVAYGLALLASKDISHPPLEVVITVDEEVGLCGAAALNMDNLKGRMLINIDSEEEGKFLASSAGGIRTKHSIPVMREDTPENLIVYKIGIRGLKGGHSGAEIDKGRGNSNKLLGRVLHDITTEMVCFISDINGGFKTNAIPREADATVLIASEDTERFLDKIAGWDRVFKNEFKVSDSGVSVNAERLDIRVDSIFVKETAKKAVASLIMIPNGVQTMSMDIEGLVESSTNLGIVQTTDSEITFESSIRSCIKTLKQNILNQSRMAADLVGADFTTYSDYPEWQYDADSRIRSLCMRVFEGKFGIKPSIIAVHGGIECGIFKEKVPDLDMVSIGPNMYDVHTPQEHISISSVEKTWEFLLTVLKEIK